MVINILDYSFEEFITYVASENSKISENIRKTSERFRRDFGDKVLVLLLLIIFNKDITAKEAAKIIGVSDRTVENYFIKLRSANIIERIGADFGGYWTL